MLEIALEEIRIAWDALRALTNVLDQCEHEALCLTSRGHSIISNHLPDGLEEDISVVPEVFPELELVTVSKPDDLGFCPEHRLDVLGSTLHDWELIGKDERARLADLFEIFFVEVG